MSFQSRLGPAAWMTPSTTDTLQRLAKEGARRVVVLTPSFVADCLETLEEIAIAGAETFRNAGGSVLRVAPCVNADPRWVEAARALVA